MRGNMKAARHRDELHINLQGLERDFWLDMEADDQGVMNSQDSDEQGWSKLLLELPMSGCILLKSRQFATWCMYTSTQRVTAPDKTSRS